MRFLPHWVLLLAGCLASTALGAREVRVAAAADLQAVLPVLAAEFQVRHPDFRVQASHAASGSLFAQIRNGAPYDVFLSADLDYPRRLATEGLALETNVFTYGLGRLVIWAPNASKLDLAALGHRALLEPSVRRIAVANPRHAPTGAAALAALRALRIQEAVEPRLVHGENVAQAAQFVQSGAADLGILTLSLALAPSLRDAGRHWVFPAAACPPLAQGGIVLRTAREPAGARAFRDFLLGPDGRALLARAGLEPPARP
jgi:molybdate transport system substrate-binding protein